MFKKVIKNTSLLSSGVGLSIFLGLIRDIIIAAFFGTSAVLESFIVAFRTPNLFRSILGEGFSSSVAVPFLSGYRENKTRMFELSYRLLSLLGVVAICFVLLCIIFSKYIVMAVAPGFVSQTEKFLLAVVYAKKLFIYLFFISLAVNLLAVLSALRRFIAATLIFSVLNISFIIGLLLFKNSNKADILVISVLAGGICQIIIPYIFLLKEGYRFRFSFCAALKDREVIKMIKLFIPRIFASAIYNLSVLIDTVLASLTFIVGNGAMAALWYAGRFTRLPVALFTYPILSVAIVDLSYYHKNGSAEEFKKLIVFSLQNIIFFVLPLTLFYMFMSEEIIDTAFKRGNFGQYSLSITAYVLSFYSLGLLFFCGVKLFVGIFHSLKDTVTPVKVSALTQIINVGLSVILMFPLKIGGVVLGSSIAAMFNFILLYILLIKKIGKIDWEDTTSHFIKVFIVSLLTVLIMKFLWVNSSFTKYIKMPVVLGLGSFIFLGVGTILRVKQIEYIKQWIERRSLEKK